MKKYYLFLIILFIVSSCTYNKTEITPYTVCNKSLVSYNNEIAPLIKAKCSTGLGPGTGCHDAWILNYDGLKKIANNKLLLKTVLDKSMPKVPNNFNITALTDDEIEMIECWVENNSPEN